MPKNQTLPKPARPGPEKGKGLDAMSCSSLRRSGRVIARFSCGAASAVATKLAIEKYGDAVEIFYTDTRSEHDDNVRFLLDCEEWFGRRVNVLGSRKFANIDDVFESRKFLVNHMGAPCTSEMKRIPGDEVWRVGDVEIYGYHSAERHRVARWQAQNTERIIECPLIDRGLSKEDALGMLDRVGIVLPTMYLQGFANNNCIGCVKARDNINYWKRVRKFYPEVFARRARQERKFNVAINHITRNGVRAEIYLDEIEEGDPKGDDFTVTCGLFCMSEADSFSETNASAMAPPPQRLPSTKEVPGG